MLRSRQKQDASALSSAATSTSEIVFGHGFQSKWNVSRIYLPPAETYCDPEEYDTKNWKPSPSLPFAFSLCTSDCVSCCLCISCASMFLHPKCLQYSRICILYFCILYMKHACVCACRAAIGPAPAQVFCFTRTLRSHRVLALLACRRQKCLR